MVSESTWYDAVSHLGTLSLKTKRITGECEKASLFLLYST
jgi:hypothetical protein